MKNEASNAYNHFQVSVRPQAQPLSLNMAYQRSDSGLDPPLVRTPSVVCVRKADEPSLAHDAHPLPKQLGHGFNVPAPVNMHCLCVCARARASLCVTGTSTLFGVGTRGRRRK